GEAKNKNKSTQTAGDKNPDEAAHDAGSKKPDETAPSAASVGAENAPVTAGAEEDKGRQA
ncbi:MAG: hypothetical protein LBD82_02465, partial [Deltaproteobacteria bacterium]|nr:hypothetical protein [Deltaproteobacteria bacterium]